jgi:hypothetical protein
MIGIELAFVAKRKFNLYPIEKNAENKVRKVEVVQQQRLTQQSDKRLAPGDEVLVSCISGDQAKIKVGVCIRCAPGIGAVEGSGHDTLICLACCYKVISGAVQGITHLLS